MSAVSRGLTILALTVAVCAAFRVEWNGGAWRAGNGRGAVVFRVGLTGEVEAMAFEAIPGETWELARRTHTP